MKSVFFRKFFNSCGWYRKTIPRRMARGGIHGPKDDLSGKGGRHIGMCGDRDSTSADHDEELWLCTQWNMGWWWLDGKEGGHRGPSSAPLNIASAT